MDGRHFAELTAFMAIHETRSFRDAAARLGVTASALSRTLRRLEDRLGLRLINRTTRSVSSTEAGLLLYAKLAPAVSSVEAAVEDAIALRTDLMGTVKLNLPRLAAELIMMPRLSKFRALYPGVRIDMVIDDALTDIVAKGFDAGIRIGERLAQDMIAVRLTKPYRIAVVGSPAYFLDRPRPETPYDLTAHDCINYRWSTNGQIYRWPFTDSDSALEVDVDGSLVLNDTGFIREAALAGLGLACLPEAIVEAHFENGELVRVLDDWCAPFPGFYLYHPSRHQTPAGLKALISFLQTEER
ncbi:LysR family transcriptional regulator [Rhizobium sp. SAFR-030]|uniref:LysR family transcriptional regulator n=1 Tax=Rhizobium sp. SAFR-030 TaxID=3387277 RepID=UPI003F81E176